ncbi:MAG: aconitate hydratase AcnA [Burkholderiales bacterium]|nr:MAG: aconitate hydratase AcnA [Betaproteobacteria bacterium]TAG79545.1 MAG: aconitate hydratase AcnA [Burkholderiales bacterium]
MNTQFKKPLPNTSLHFFDAREAVNTLASGAWDKLPYTARVHAENIVRKAEPAKINDYLKQLIERKRELDFPWFPARVVCHDILGQTALVDLAGLRDAIADQGGDPAKVNPVVPVQLIVDHSLAVECGGYDPKAFEKNRAIEDRRNEDRFHFINWTKEAFKNVDVIPPGNGIMHQINLERMSPVIGVQDGVAYPDTCVGTDSHTPHVDALGVIAVGVGGLEAENVMLGRASWMRLPDIVGVELSGKRQEGITATDIVLALTEFLRKQKVVGAYLEFYGEGASSLTLGDRATISNMAPEYGATAAMFFIDQQTLDYLTLTGREAEQVKLVETYAKHTGLWADALATAEYERVLKFDLSTVVRNMAGPSNPHARVATTDLLDKGIATGRRVPAEAGINRAFDGESAVKPEPTAGASQPSLHPPSGPPLLEGEGIVHAETAMPDGAVIIAAITSCTNTSNPRNVIAAALLARNANKLGLTRKPWVKSSLAPGSKTVELYLQEAGLLGDLEALGFGIVAFACTTCNGMSGALDPKIQQEIIDHDLYATAVLSGNRNFDGRIHPYAKQAFLASPPLVIAYAIAGTIRFDIELDALGVVDGKPITLKDLWPSDEEIDAVVAKAVKPEQFRKVYEPMFAINVASGVQAKPLYDWRAQSTYIRRPPYWEGALAGERTLKGMRPLAVLGDNITTDHLSPSNAIMLDSAAGEYLAKMGLPEEDFNSYATHRGDHLTAQRATFANPTLQNEMVKNADGSIKKGSLARIEPEGKVTRMWEAIETYMDRKQPLIIIAGADYGQGSSRDWAAKGVRLAGVEAIVAEGFERIHRTNLIGMGVLPLEFKPGTNRKTLGIDGTETFDVIGERTPRATLTLVVNRKNGERVEVPVTCRLDTAEEISVYDAGGVLQRFAKDFLEQEAV